MLRCDATVSHIESGRSALEGCIQGHILWTSSKWCKESGGAPALTLFPKERYERWQAVIQDYQHVILIHLLGGLEEVTPVFQGWLRHSRNMSHLLSEGALPLFHSSC